MLGQNCSSVQRNNWQNPIDEMRRQRSSIARSFITNSRSSNFSLDPPKPNNHRPPASSSPGGGQIRTLGAFTAPIRVGRGGGVVEGSVDGEELRSGGEVKLQLLRRGAGQRGESERRGWGGMLTWGREAHGSSGEVGARQVVSAGEICWARSWGRAGQVGRDWKLFS